MSKSGKLIVIVAPSGTGKSTLITKLKRELPEIKESVSFTTRKRREGEVDGVNYHYIEKAKFEEMRDADEFLEWAVVHGNYYGTSKTVVAKGLENGDYLLFDLDVQGCDSMKEVFPEAKVIFIEPPSVNELEKRLRGRGTESTDIIDLRLNNAKEELKRKDDFDFKVLNDHFDSAYENLKRVVLEIIEG